MLASMANTDDFVDAIAGDAEDLLALVGATGAVAVFEGRIARAGDAPDDAVIENLLAWLDTRSEDVFATDKLAANGRARAGAWDPNAGVLVVSLSRCSATT
jgi:light-regulated signal transduction histidine kinase (bacteriophytochrome)